VEQQLAAVRLRLDNLLIKQSIFDRPEPDIVKMKDAVLLTCGNGDDFRKSPGRPKVLPELRG
jgi:hypothetical protein